MRLPRKAKKAIKSENWKGTLFPRPTLRNQRYLRIACRAYMRAAGVWSPGSEKEPRS